MKFTHKASIISLLMLASASLLQSAAEGQPPQRGLLEQAYDWGTGMMGSVTAKGEMWRVPDISLTSIFDGTASPAMQKEYASYSDQEKLGFIANALTYLTSKLNRTGVFNVATSWAELFRRYDRAQYLLEQIRKRDFAVEERILQSLRESMRDFLKAVEEEKQIIIRAGLRIVKDALEEYNRKARDEITMTVLIDKIKNRAGGRVKATETEEQSIVERALKELTAELASYNEVSRKSVTLEYLLLVISTKWGLQGAGF